LWGSFLFEAGFCTRANQAAHGVSSQHQPPSFPTFFPLPLARLGAFSGAPWETPFVFSGSFPLPQFEGDPAPLGPRASTSPVPQPFAAACISIAPSPDQPIFVSGHVLRAFVFSPQ